MNIGNLHDIRAIVLDATGTPGLRHPDDLDFSGAGVRCLGVVGLRRVECSSSMWSGTRLHEYPDLLAVPMPCEFPAELLRVLIAEYSAGRISSAAWLRQLYALPDLRD